MGKNLATILAADGITVNTVAPAMIQATGMIPTPKNTQVLFPHMYLLVYSINTCLALGREVPISRPWLWRILVWLLPLACLSTVSGCRRKSATLSPCKPKMSNLTILYMLTFF